MATEDRRPLRVLVEMRPALEGFAGIPQEVRLLFRGLAHLPGVSVAGLLQHSGRILAKGLPPSDRKQLSPARASKRQSDVVVTMTDDRKDRGIRHRAAVLRRRLLSLWLTLRMTLGFPRVQLTRFVSPKFQDFTWRTLFAKTLPPEDRLLVSERPHRVCSVPWQALHRVGRNTLKWRSMPQYPQLDTRGYDVFIGQTPYPGRVAKGTKMVIRYHDAVPVFMPHVVPQKELHQAHHYNALRANVADGAWFACVSEATRQDLLYLFPEVEARAVTIHNMVSGSYFPEDTPAERVPAIIRRRLNEQSGWLPKLGSGKPDFYRQHLFGTPFRYLLMVSTIEPRKNHLRLISAWEQLRAEGHDDLKLVLAGTLGWDNDEVKLALQHWLETGDAFLVQRVPAPELRLLYRHAALTVCPSLAEGFDYSGVEAMRSGGLVAASDIAVHREVYASGAAYFDPYSTDSLLSAVQGVLEGGAEAEDIRAAGADLSTAYLPENILPKWDAFLAQVNRA